MLSGDSVPTSLFGSVVRNPKRSTLNPRPSSPCAPSVHFGVQMPAKNASGRVSFRANCRWAAAEPSGITSFSAKLVRKGRYNGSRPRASDASASGVDVARMFVTPGSPSSCRQDIWAGSASPYRISASSRPLRLIPHDRAQHSLGISPRHGQEGCPVLSFLDITPAQFHGSASCLESH